MHDPNAIHDSVTNISPVNPGLCERLKNFIGIKEQSRTRTAARPPAEICILRFSAVQPSPLIRAQRDAWEAFPPRAQLSHARAQPTVHMPARPLHIEED